MKIFWISWYQPTDDHRPLSFPPNESILGWWCTGQRCSDDSSTLCAMIVAEDEAYAKIAIRKDWPEAGDWRFCDESKNTDLCDRFPTNDWMKIRIGQFNNKSRVT